MDDESRDWHGRIGGKERKGPDQEKIDVEVCGHQKVTESRLTYAQRSDENTNHVGVACSLYGSVSAHQELITAAF